MRIYYICITQAKKNNICFSQNNHFITNKSKKIYVIQMNKRKRNKTKQTV